MLETNRLILRHWKPGDLEAFAALNANARVMEYFPHPLTKAQSDALAQKIIKKLDDNGWGFWAAELKSSSKFIGFVGLNRPSDALPCSPCVEIGWRLAFEHWGKGYATEAAKACIEYGFCQLNLSEIVAFAVKENKRSRAVMEKIGMHNTQQDFMHPDIPERSPLSRHVLYKITQGQQRNG